MVTVCAGFSTCIYVNVYNVYICIHIYTYACIHLLYMYTCICTCTCIYLYIYTYLFLKYAHICTHKYICIHTCTYIYAYMCVHTYCAYTYIYIYSHVMCHRPNNLCPPPLRAICTYDEYLFTHAYIYTHMYIRIHLHTHVSTLTPTCVITHTQVHLQYIDTYIFILDILIHVHSSLTLRSVNTCACNVYLSRTCLQYIFITHVSTHAYICVYENMYIHIYTFVYTHMYVHMAPCASRFDVYTCEHRFIIGAAQRYHVRLQYVAGCRSGGQRVAVCCSVVKIVAKSNDRGWRCAPTCALTTSAPCARILS